MEEEVEGEGRLADSEGVAGVESGVPPFPPALGNFASAFCLDESASSRYKRNPTRDAWVAQSVKRPVRLRS